MVVSGRAAAWAKFSLDLDQQIAVRGDWIRQIDFRQRIRSIDRQGLFIGDGFHDCSLSLVDGVLVMRPVLIRRVPVADSLR
jgi:hypothetical protein